MIVTASKIIVVDILSLSRFDCFPFLLQAPKVGLSYHEFWTTFSSLIVVPFSIEYRSPKNGHIWG